MINIILNVLQWTFIGLFTTLSILIVTILLFFLFASQVDDLPTEERGDLLIQDEPRLFEEE